MQSFDEKSYDIFEMFRNQWALATAGNLEKYNTCTIGWGSLGTIWGRSVVTVYVQPERLTWEYLKNSDIFTVDFFAPEYREALSYLGSHSGRDEDKVVSAGLHPKALAGGVTFEEANLTFVCRKLFQGPFSREGLNETLNDGIYANWEPHWMFVGEIIEVEDHRYPRQTQY